MSRQGVTAELSRVPPPQQARSRRAQQAALDAFAALLAERPLSRVTVQEVADLAGLSITSLYARFAGKQALVLALHERVIDEALGQLDAALADDAVTSAPIEEVVAALVGAAITFADAHTHVFRAVLISGDAETNERAAAFIRAQSERIAEALAHRDPAPSTERDVDFAWRSVVAVLQQSWALDGADPGRFPLDRFELATRLTRQFLAAIDSISLAR